MPERLRRALPAVAVLVAGCTVYVPLPSVDDPPATPTAAAASSASSAGSASVRPTPTTRPAATASAAPAAFELDVIGCNGGVMLDWTPVVDPAFHHYTALRSPIEEIDPAWPPIAPAVDWGDTYITDAFVTSAVDASIVPSETRWFYRVMAYDAVGRVLARTPVRSTRMEERETLDRIVVTPLADGVTRLSWSAFEGDSDCFSSYRVLVAGGSDVSSVIDVIADRDTTELETDALHPGVTYTIRVEAVRTATHGSFVVGEATPASYVVPPTATTSPP